MNDREKNFLAAIKAACGDQPFTAGQALDAIADYRLSEIPENLTDYFTERSADTANKVNTAVALEMRRLGCRIVRRTKNSRLWVLP